MKKLKQDNRGFSLIELVVTAAILGVVTLAVALMMSSGSGLFRSLSTISGLQNRSQVTMAQLQEYMLDVNGGITVDGSEAWFTVYEDEESGRIYHLRYDSAAGSLLFDEGSVTVDPGAMTLTYTYHSSMVTLCSDVSAFRLTAASTDGDKADAITVELTLSDRGKNCRSTQVFALRNSPALVAPAAGSGTVESLLTRVWFADHAPGSLSYTETPLIS